MSSFPLQTSSYFAPFALDVIRRKILDLVSVIHVREIQDWNIFLVLFFISYRCDLIKGLVCTSRQIQLTKNQISWLVSAVISTDSARTTCYFVIRTQWQPMTPSLVMNGETKRIVPTQWVLILAWRILIGKAGLRKVKIAHLQISCIHLRPCSFLCLLLCLSTILCYLNSVSHIIQHECVFGGFVSKARHDWIMSIILHCTRMVLEVSVKVSSQMSGVIASTCRFVFGFSLSWYIFSEWATKYLDGHRGVWKCGQTVLSVIYIISQSKLKLRRKRRHKIVKIYAN